MKDLSTEEKNEVIAKFCGGETKARLYPSDKIIIHIPERGNCYVEDLKYHSSWDWLMPVINKLKTTNLKGWEVGKVNQYLKLRSEILYPLNKESGEADVKECHEVVYNMIQWYNNQKP